MLRSLFGARPMTAWAGIHTEAASAWRQLDAALRDLEDHGRRPVCTTRPNDWTSPHRQVRRDAAEACGWCPVANQCHQFATANRERRHVWAGRDLTPRQKATP